MLLVEVDQRLEKRLASVEKEFEKEREENKK
jgi:hypothetical protein